MRRKRDFVYWRNAFYEKLSAEFLEKVYQMSRTTKTVQNEMWNQLRKTHCPVTIYLCNGVRLSRVVVVSFDMFAVTVRTGGETHLVCKSNIATVLPETKREKHPAPSYKRPETSRSSSGTSKPVITVKRSLSRLPSTE
jgi:RNA chaperone Hfq